MSKKQFFIGIFLASLLSGIIAVGGYRLLAPAPAVIEVGGDQQEPLLTSYLNDSSFTVPAGLNFVFAAEKVTPTVVHIRSTYNGSGGDASAGRNPLEEFFREYWGDGQGAPRDPNQRRGPARAFGSGVIISADGYIATNNHVVEGADEVQVTMNDNRVYDAEIIGTDPTTDLAMLKIKENNLPHVKFGNSDVVRVGEWVLAVGNPFDLTSTVTAGIVSAKARNINILRDQSGLQIESFIQTDAAVNKGNSGGALVNLKGDLIGINTAIITPTGVNAGYSFAVPSSIVRKVMRDLKEFGMVQRALLGVQIRSVDADLADQFGLNTLNGVYILGVTNGSAAREAGIEEGDVIMSVNDVNINTVSELQEQIARYRPGDEVDVVVLRNNKRRDFEVNLKNSMGDTELVRNESSISIGGARFREVTDAEARDLDIQGGVRVIDLGRGKFNDAGVEEGFVVTSVNKQAIRSVNDLMEVLQNSNGGMLFEGVNADGTERYYAMKW
ncbi:MAG: Do family serine endopeptidase [Cyclobacteriaceae bacterium]